MMVFAWVHFYTMFHENLSAVLTVELGAHTDTRKHKDILAIS